MIENIEKIIKIFEDSKISKLDLELGDMKIKLEKDEKVSAPIYTEASGESNNTICNVNTATDNNTYVKSPVVGTFYQQRAEKHPPFITKGQKVKKGDVLCIIEAMKVMNEITSPVDGTILDILVNNEDLVQFDQDLVIIGE